MPKDPDAEVKLVIRLKHSERVKLVGKAQTTPERKLEDWARRVLLSEVQSDEADKTE